MTPSTVRAQLEEERAWRADEMRLLRNQLGALPSDEQRATYRKTLVVMLYSHFEGFCRNAFSIFVHALNSQGLKIADVNWSLAAAALAEVFNKLQNRDLKSKIFRRVLPDDSRLHRFARERDFLESLDGFEQRDFDLDPDVVADTESNLNPAVVRKMLYRLGFDHELASQWDARLHELLGRRNNVAHGASRAGIDAAAYASYEQTANAVMDAITEAIFRELADQRFRRVPPGAPAPAPAP